MRGAERADGRITAIAHRTPAVHQAAVVSSLARMAASLGATWILPFDADELWIATDRSGQLPDALASATERGADAIAVGLENFVAPSDCDESQLSDLPRFCYRIAPTTMESGDDLSPFQTGGRAFISCAYPDKLILRATPHARVGPGAHTAPSVSDTGPPEPSAQVRCLHIPLRSRQSMLAKAAHGRLLRSSGYPSWHGWQQQMLADLEPEGQLDRVWAANSYAGTGDGATTAAGEVLVPDATLGELYAELSGHPLLDPAIAVQGSDGTSDEAASTSWLAITETLMLEAERSDAKRSAALDLAEQTRRAISDQLERERAQRVGVERDLAYERAQRMGVERELEDERARRMSAERELEHERVQRMSAERELALIVGSRPFRLTAWIRALAFRLRRWNGHGHDRPPANDEPGSGTQRS